MSLKTMRPSPGALIGMIALVFALTGAAVAAEKITTSQIADRAITGPKIARDAVKSGKIIDGKVKAQDLAEGVLPKLAYGRVDKAGVSATVAGGAVGITGVAAGGAGTICYDLASTPVAGSANVVHEAAGPPGSTAELTIGASPDCASPFTDAASFTQRSTDGTPVDEDVYVQFVG